MPQFFASVESQLWSPNARVADINFLLTKVFTSSEEIVMKIS